MKYYVEIVETLNMIVSVEAQSESEAIYKVMDEYRKEKYVLTADNYVGTEFNIMEDYRDEVVEED